MQRKPNRKDACQVSFHTNEQVFNNFGIKISDDNIQKKDVLTTAVRAYIHGEATTVTKDGREIYFKCEIK